MASHFYVTIDGNRKKTTLRTEKITWKTLQSLQKSVYYPHVFEYNVFENISLPL